MYMEVSSINIDREKPKKTHREIIKEDLNVNGLSKIWLSPQQDQYLEHEVTTIRETVK